MGSWLKTLFSESGAASYSRFASFVALVSTIVWVSYVVWHTRHIPELTGPIAFPATLYGLGKGAETAERFRSKAAESEDPKIEEAK
jgi:hypothetical protein